jgi:RND family efflux transporter MFP subunit
MSDQLSNDLASLRIRRDAPPERPKRALGWLFALAGFGAVAAGTVTVGVPYAEKHIFKPEVAVTEIALVSPAQASVELAATGYVVAQVVAKVGPKVTGRIVKVEIREGDAVKAGQLLFLLDPSDQKSAVASAQAKAAAARARAAAARAKAQVARATLGESKIQYDRIHVLVEKGAEARATGDDLAAKVKSLNEQVGAADSEAHAADADATASDAEVAALAVQLDNTQILSPMNGKATTKPAEVGDVVTPASTLVELTDFDSLLMEVDVPESKLGQAKKGSPCEVVLDAYSDKRLRGEVVEVSPRLNRAKATGTVKVKIVDPLEGILPEMAGRVSFLAKALDAEQMKEPPKHVIPANAVVDRSGAKVAFVIEDGKVRMVPLKLGPAFGGGFQLIDGPAPGTHVVKDPSPELNDGVAVKEKGSS